MKVTFVADMQKDVVMELLRKQRDYGTPLYPRVGGRSADYVVQHRDSFVGVKITLEFSSDGKHLLRLSEKPKVKRT